MNCLTFDNIKDFDLEHIFECGQCFRWVPSGDGTGDYVGAAGSYAARISYDRNECRLRIEATGGDEAFWSRYFDLTTDYSAIMEELKAGEPKMAEALNYGCGIRILNQDLFETVISFIISQNNNIPRIRKCIETICRRYGEYIGEVSGREWYAFPRPEVLAEADVDDLMSLKLGYRSGYIKAASEKFVEDSNAGRLPREREDILCYRGVGPKVANCIMLFGLRQTDAFPIDTWVKQIMNDMYGFEESDIKGMESFAREKFGSLAGYAQQYLFYYYRDNSLHNGVDNTGKHE